MQDSQKAFLNIAKKEPISYKRSLQKGEFDGIRDVLKKNPDEIIDYVKKSTLRGRGGAGFSSGMKWSFIPKNDNKPHYLVINADESEPGTCKDREIITHEPYKIITGALIASRAICANVCYIYIRGEYCKEYKILEEVIQDCYKNGVLGKNAMGSDHDLDIYVHRGAGAYICGEESAQLESIEGKKGQPRLKPPFPALIGLYGCPTVINNVETIAMVPSIFQRGVEWFLSFGSENNKGPKIFSVSGHVNKPCIVEESMSISLKILINDYAGGVQGGWDDLVAVIPGGSSVPLITKDMAENAVMDFDSLRSIGSSFGTGGIIVINKSVDLVKAIARISYFYKHESCGQCTPCREGTGWIYRLLTRISEGNAKISEIDQLYDLTKQIEGHTICALGDAAAWPVQGLIKHFRSELEKRCQLQ